MKKVNAEITKVLSKHNPKYSSESAKHEVKGNVKELTGKVTGNKSRKVAGKIKKNTGMV